MDRSLPNLTQSKPSLAVSTGNLLTSSIASSVHIDCGCDSDDLDDTDDDELDVVYEDIYLMLPGCSSPQPVPIYQAYHGKPYMPASQGLADRVGHNQLVRDGIASYL